MSDNEVRAYYRQVHPHMSMVQAKEVYRTWLKFRHLGALAESKQREAADAERRWLRERLFGVESGSDVDAPLTIYVNGDTQLVYTEAEVREAYDRDLAQLHADGHEVVTLDRWIEDQRDLGLLVVGIDDW
jgi:hypothetical protein